MFVDERMDEVAEDIGRTTGERLGDARERAHVTDVRRLGSWLGIELCDPGGRARP